MMAGVVIKALINVGIAFSPNEGLKPFQISSLKHRV